MAGGLIKGNRHVTVDKDTPMTNLMLSMMDILGVHADKLGDCTGRLATFAAVRTITSVCGSHLYWGCWERLPLRVPAMAGVPEVRLFQAVKPDDHETIKSLLAAHADVNAPLPDKSTVLAWAVDRQDEESVRLLLAAGARPDVSDDDGAVPLTLACELGNPAIVERSAEGRRQRAGRAARRHHRFRALCGDTSTPQALAALVDKGADVNAADASGQTALMRAAIAGNDR